MIKSDAKKLLERWKKEFTKANKEGRGGELLDSSDIIIQALIEETNGFTQEAEIRITEGIEDHNRDEKICNICRCFLKLVKKMGRGQIGLSRGNLVFSP